MFSNSKHGLPFCRSWRKWPVEGWYLNLQATVQVCKVQVWLSSVKSSDDDASSSQDLGRLFALRTGLATCEGVCEVHLKFVVPGFQSM